MENHIDHALNPREVVPVFIRDFLEDYTLVGTIAIQELFFNLKHASGPDNNVLIQLPHATDVEITVLRPEFFASTDSLLDYVAFEAAMKMLPTNRIVKLFLTLYDGMGDCEYRTNGIRISIDTHTNLDRKSVV